MLREDNSIINLMVRGHKVSIKDNTIVYVRHSKKCKNPCPMTELIVNYLKAEMFIFDGFILADTQQ
jgi:hypothetical protein